MNTAAPKEKHQTSIGQAAVPATGTLRILATTDLHMHLTAHNFVTDQPIQNPGLSGIATLVAQARAEAAQQGIGCVLFDNGDLLQGTAMGAWLAQRPVSDDHPAIASLNALEYDAIGIGNHDLDYGMPYLRDVAQRLHAPVIASNLIASDFSPLTPSALIPCKLPSSEEGPDRVITIGVLSVLPLETELWNRHRLNGIAKVVSAPESLRVAVPNLRARGADLIVVLAHMGLDQNAKNRDTAVPLAQIPGVDAMVTGHTHRRFPGRDHATANGVNGQASTVAQVPAVMPGHAGSDLAVLDLKVRKDAQGRWHVTDHDSALRSNTADTPPAPAVVAAAAKVHPELRSHLGRVAGVSASDLHNYFTLAVPTNLCALTARAKAKIARAGLADLPEADLPLLAASSAHTAGGRDGPQNYLHIPKGPVLRRHLWGMNPYGNQVWVLRLTGAELLARLEHAATVYQHLRPGTPKQPLRNPERPAFDFDTIFGLHYRIDPTRPAGQRVFDVTYEGTRLPLSQDFLLATNQFRAAGGGGYAVTPSDRVVVRCAMQLEDGLTQALGDPVEPSWDLRPWSLTPSVPVTATLETAPAAKRYLSDLASITARPESLNEDGFLQVQLTF